ncbi:MAG TPA: hypothetical protein VL172_06140 [Kofleriaceae bacterium]|nr:hypothetical protein [Kofleriaceae bacterium]
MKRALFLFALTVAGCAADADKPMPDEDFSSLDGADGKSDYFSSRLRILGALEDGDARDAYYTSWPRFRGYTLDGAGSMDLGVSSETGDAIAWVLDSHFNVLARNDDADDTTYDAHITVDIPAAEAWRTHYLVFRDYDLRRGWFTVERAAAGPSLACTGGGLIATIGDECMDDGGVNGVGDGLEIYCSRGLTRFCLSGEACPWRDGRPAVDDGTTCSHAGLEDSAESEEYGQDFMAHATCSPWQDHEWYYCDAEGQIRFSGP